MCRAFGGCATPGGEGLLLPSGSHGRFSGRGGAIRGGAVRERGGVSCPDHRGGAGSGIDSTYVRGGVGSPMIRSRSAPLPSLACCFFSE
jgi:hypothetical protein